VGNGDPSSHEPDKGESRRAFNGRCVAIVQATRTAGEIQIEATGQGLAPGTLIIKCDPAALRPAVS